MGHEERTSRVLQMPGPAVPIIGQPFEIRAIRLTVDVDAACRCDPSDPVALTVSEAPVFCSKCGKGYAVQGLRMQDGQPNVQIQILTPQPKPSGVDKEAAALLADVDDALRDLPAKSPYVEECKG